MSNYHQHLLDILHACGSEIIGRIRLQKLAYLAKQIGCDFGFEFEYYRYGPFSETLAQTIQNAVDTNKVEEKFENKKVGFGQYSIFTLKGNIKKKHSTFSDEHSEFLKTAKKIDALFLELLATALFLFTEEKEPDPWKKLKRLKPEKASDKYLKKSYGHYDELQKLSEQLGSITTLPKLPAPS